MTSLSMPVGVGRRTDPGIGARCRALVLGAVLALPAQPAGWTRRLLGRRTRSASPATGPDHFNDVILVHMDAAYNLARYLTGDPSEADDIVQDALLKAHQGFAGFRGENARAWLLTIVRRGVIDWSCAQRAGRTVFSECETLEDAAGHVADPTASAEALLSTADQVSLVRRALQALPEPFRESLILREIESLSYREVADITGVPIGTVMSRLARGRELLARILQAEGASTSSEVFR